MSRPAGHPIVVSLAGASVVIVGGGAVAERKVESLRDTGARITVIAPSLTAGLEGLGAQGEILVVRRVYAPGDLAGARLAYVATDDPDVSHAVHREATERSVWLNVADRPELCGFTVPAVLRRGDLAVAVSTGGASPAMARRIREQLEGAFGPEYAVALAILRRVRERVQARGGDLGEMRDGLMALAGPDLLRAVAARDARAVDALLGAALGPGVTLDELGMDLSTLAEAGGAEAPRPGARRPGRVFLVGAGPGDPDLLTLKGQACLRASDVIVYDALVDKRVLEHAHPGATLVYAGKREGHHSRPQEEISALLVEHARAGRTVTRLKGGDPFVFGRGGEEALALAEAGIAFEVVPGVSAGVAVPAYAGIPVTHRDVSASVTFVTGHARTGADLSSVDWDALGRDRGTLVFFMGLRNLPQIAGALVARGRPAATPAAVVGCGTTERQVTVTGTLADIVERARHAGIEPPALVVVGEVVALRDRLAWFPELRAADPQG